MKVNFKSFGLLRRLLGSKILELEVQEPATIRDVIDKVLEIGGSDVKNLIVDRDRISGNLIVMLNLKDTNTLDGENTPVRDGDEVAVLPHVQGG